MAARGAGLSLCVLLPLGARFRQRRLMQHTAVGAACPLRPQGGAHGRTSRPEHIATTSALTRSAWLRLTGYIRVAIRTAPRFRLFQLSLLRPRRRSGCFLAVTTCAHAQRPAKHTSRRPLPLAADKQGRNGLIERFASGPGPRHARRPRHPRVSRPRRVLRSRTTNDAPAPSSGPAARQRRRPGERRRHVAGIPSPAPGSATEAPGSHPRPAARHHEGGRGGRFPAVIWWPAVREVLARRWSRDRRRARRAGLPSPPLEDRGRS